MIHKSIDGQPKGWLAGPWDSGVPIAVGYANKGIAINHFHAQMYEIYLVARGSTVAIVEGHEIALSAGEMLVVEPGEVHTFGKSSPDYMHFVLQTPFVPGDKTLVEES